MRRSQFPLAPALPQTIHSIQGTTADPGLIAHFDMPDKLDDVAKWLALYVLLSRVQSLANLLSVGLPEKHELERGPPPKLKEMLQGLLKDKIEKTKADCKAAREYLGWPPRL